MFVLQEFRNSTITPKAASTRSESLRDIVILNINHTSKLTSPPACTLCESVVYSLNSLSGVGKSLKDFTSSHSSEPIHFAMVKIFVSLNSVMRCSRYCSLS